MGFIMATLYDILKNNELYKYPPLPKWVKETVDILQKNPESDEYYNFTYSIRFSKIDNKWTRSTED
jgi:hypothetical protein